jgi:hypothetical protein
MSMCAPPAASRPPDNLPTPEGAAPRVGDVAEAWRLDWPGYDFRSYTVFVRVRNALQEGVVGGRRDGVTVTSALPFLERMTGRLVP